MTFPYKLIDLTHTLESSIPTWNGSCGFNHQIKQDYKDCSGDIKFRIMKFSMHAGVGTHMDAPSHCIAGGASIHELELDDLCMPCVVIDISDKAQERYSLTTDDVITFENTYGSIAKGSCVLIKTGWERFWHTPEQYRNNLVFPSVSHEAANLLLTRGVMALGIDTPSPDRPEDGFNVHQVFLGGGKILLENVANLNSMPPINGFVMALPIKVKEATEAPVRLVGMIKV